MKRRTIALLCLASITAAGCSHPEDPIRVGAVYPLTGTQAEGGGLDEFRGAELAATLVNEDGGVGGRPIELVPIDVPSADAAPGAIGTLHDRGVDLVLGSYGSTISQPAAEGAALRDMLFWETGAVGEMTGTGAGELVFRVSPTGGTLGHAAVSFIVDELAPVMHRDARSLRFAVANVDDVYGRSVAQGALDEIGHRELTLVGTFPYDPHGTDLKALARSIARSDPDVLFVSAYLEDGVALRRETVREGLDLVASIGTSSSYCHPAFGEALGENALGLFASDKPDSGSLNTEGLTTEARDLLARASASFRDRYGRGDECSRPERLLGGLGPVPRRHPPRELGRSGGRGQGRARDADPPRGPPQRQRAVVRRTGHAGRRREPEGGERHLGVGRGRTAGRGLAAAVRDDEHPADRHRSVSVRARALGWGVLIVALYVAGAIVSGHLSPLARRPLLDGFIPPAPYRWVDPPPELANSNLPPASGKTRILIGPQGSAAAFFATDDAQVTLNVPKGAFPARPGNDAVVVTIEPVDPASVGALPGRLSVKGNVYLIAAAYRPTGDRAQRLDASMVAILTYPSLSDDLGEPHVGGVPGREAMEADRDAGSARHQAGHRADPLAGIPRGRQRSPPVLGTGRHHTSR